MSGIVKTIQKALPNEIPDPARDLVLKSDYKANTYLEKSVLGLHKPGPVTLLQPTPGDPNIANAQARQAALAAQRSGRAATVLSQPNADSLGG